MTSDSQVGVLPVAADLGPSRGGGAEQVRRARVCIYVA